MNGPDPLPLEAISEGQEVEHSSLRGRRWEIVTVEGAWVRVREHYMSADYERGPIVALIPLEDVKRERVKEALQAHREAWANKREDELGLCGWGDEHPENFWEGYVAPKVPEDAR